MSELPKKLKLQVGVCKRLAKEVSAYEREVVDQTAKIQRMRDNNSDFYGIMIRMV
jgi:hypothetical protein